jgi:1-acyl-sn-glycerol-3-phosphate acyltransferase
MAAPMSSAELAAMYPYRARLPSPLYWLYRAARTLGVALCFAGFWTGVVVVGWLWIPLLRLWPGSPAVKIRRALRVVRGGFNVFHFAMRALRLFHRASPVGSLRPGNSPVVFVANHPTLCDVTSIMSLFPNIVAVARSGFADNPLLGRLVRITGFVPIGIHVLQDCEDRLRMGFDVLVFPEGTRSPAHGPLHPFHRGAFELAARAKVPLVLLKLTCSPPALSKRLPIWKVADHMAVLTIEPVETIDPADYPTDRRRGSRAMCRTIEQRYRDLLGYPASLAVGEPQPLGDVQ